ncbi:MAG: hypothetical protein ACRD88_12035, partial [Terriglobia bacterium]
SYVTESTKQCQPNLAEIAKKMLIFEKTLCYILSCQGFLAFFVLYFAQNSLLQFTLAKCR